MQKYLRIIIVIASVLGITLLARNKVAWASGLAHEAAQTDMAQLEARVWDDLDRDGVQDEGESGFPNITVNLYASTLELVNSTITDENGLFRFTDLTPGDYYVEVAAPVGYEISPQDRGGNEALDSDASVITSTTELKTLVAGQNKGAWDTGLYQSGAFHGTTDPGTVKPPPRLIRTCSSGDYALGGIAGLRITDLKSGYCVQAFLWNHRFGFGQIPKDAGQFLADITFVTIFRYGRLIRDLPIEDGKIMVCYAVPPGKQAQIYSFSFRQSEPSWTPLETTMVIPGVVCAPAQSTGAYALIGK